MRDVSRHHTPAFAAIAALLAAFWAAFGAAPLSGAAVVVLAGFVLVLGLPHGALDLWIARRSGLWGRQGGFVRFHALYLVLAAMVAAAFVMAPALALAGFLAISLWHFADDWRRLPLPVRIGCASIIVVVPTLFHPDAVASIFRTVTGIEAGGPAGGTGDAPYAAFAVSAWLVTGSVGAAFLYDKKAGVEVATIAGLAALLPPLIFFAAYFTLLHGPRHMMRHGGLIAGPGARLVLGLYTVLALGIVAGLGLFLAGGGDPSLGDGAIRALFVGLAALTVPHALLVEYDKYQQKQSQRNIGAANLPCDVKHRSHRTPHCVNFP